MINSDELLKRIKPLMADAKYNSTNARTVKLPGGRSFTYGPRQRFHGIGQVDGIEWVIKLIKKMQKELEK